MKSFDEKKEMQRKWKEEIEYFIDITIIVSA